ncbi:unnamed protein product [Psylliodes chrysocephalus]|uniref:Uncharacterized protein n=1 Tax=Psylliodes chrysocephalus TaxID=3402493 RepID=A0A9P0CQ62_9CUCU|nr:unnamed protein product [Psylliodes chrysocephala]
MSKVFVYVLDKVVWMLLIAALTTQALQIAGILESPKGLQEITYSKGNDYSFQLSVGPENRGKRETSDRSKLIDSLFNIPIQTLTAVNNLVQSSRPAFRSIRDYAVKRFMDSRKKTTTTEAPSESNLQKRSYPVYVRPKEDEEKYKVNVITKN